MLELLGFHLIFPDSLELTKAGFNGVKQAQVSHDSAEITTVDNRESRVSHPHSEDLLYFWPGATDHGEKLLVNILLHVKH